MSGRNILQFVSICFVCCSALMFVLFVTMGQSNKTKNGFNRHIPSGKLSIAHVVDLNNEDYYIAGNSAKEIYLGNLRKPLQLFVVDSSLHILSLHFPDSVKSAFQSARLSVDSPYVYMCEGISPRYFIGNLQHLEMDTFMSKSSFFTTATNISPGSFAVRAVNAGRNENILLKVQSDSPYVIAKKAVLTKQVDGIFCTDGQLKYDKTSNRLIYMYYYRNQCLVMDTNLNVIKTIRTIDTTSIAKINIANTSTQGSLKFSSPPEVVNASMCTDANKIYIRSALLADNEGISVIEKNNTIDVYSTVNGNYLQTLYIPKQQDESLKEIRIVKHQLVALYAHAIVFYNLPQDILLQ